MGPQSEKNPNAKTEMPNVWLKEKELFAGKCILDFPSPAATKGALGYAMTDGMQLSASSLVGGNFGSGGQALRTELVKCHDYHSISFLHIPTFLPSSNPKHREEQEREK